MKWTENLTGNVLWFAFVVFMLWKPLNAIYRTTVFKNQGQNSQGIVLPRNYVGWETWPRPDYNRGMESPFSPAERRGSMAAEILKRGPRE